MATTATRPRKKKTKEDAPKFKCDFCKHDFAKEQSYLVHMCEKKRRFLAKDDKDVKMGYMAYLRFHALNYQGKQKEPSAESFMNSKLYTSFVRFGKYILNINAINPTAFVDFLVKAQTPIDKWDSPVVYETYVRELTKRETPDAAVTRTIMLMEQWALTTDEYWYDFFRKISPVQATTWIRSGRISPWVLYTASSAADLFSRLSEEQLGLIERTIDTNFWSLKIKHNQADVAEIRELLDAAGL